MIASIFPLIVEGNTTNVQGVALIQKAIRLARNY